MTGSMGSSGQTSYYAGAVRRKDAMTRIRAGRKCFGTGTGWEAVEWLWPWHLSRPAWPAGALCSALRRRMTTCACPQLRASAPRRHGGAVLDLCPRLESLTSALPASHGSLRGYSLSWSPGQDSGQDSGQDLEQDISGSIRGCPSARASRRQGASAWERGRRYEIRASEQRRCAYTI